MGDYFFALKQKMKTSLLLACAIATTSLSPTPKVPSWDDYEQSRRFSMVFGFEYSPENYSEDWMVDNSSTYDSFTSGAGVTVPPNTSPEDWSWQDDYFGWETTTTTTITTTATTTTTTTTTATTTTTTTTTSDFDTTVVPRRKREATTVVPRKRREATTAFTTEGTTSPVDDT